MHRSVRMFPLAGDTSTAWLTLPVRLASYDAERSLLDFAAQRFEDVEQRIAKGNGWIAGPHPASSTWVRQFGYWAQNGQGGLAIEFKSGAICWYFNTGTELYSMMLASASKGRFVHEFLFKKKGYILVSN